MKYYIGYFNRLGYNKKWDFVILAETRAKAVSMFIRDSYNEGYKEKGMTVRAEIFDDDTLPEDHRYAD